jgi:hypothetical protein
VALEKEIEGNKEKLEKIENGCLIVLLLLYDEELLH